MTIQKIQVESLSVLEQALKSKNPFVRSAAVRAAGESQNPVVTPLLKRGSRDADPMTRLFAFQGLKKISQSETLALAAKIMIRDSDKWVRGAALEALGKFGGKEFRLIIRPYLRDPEISVRLAAAAALYHLGESRHIVLILSMLKNRDTNLRYQSIGYLGKIGTWEVLSFLEKLLNNKDSRIVFYVLKAIGKKAWPEIFPLLKKMTRHKDAIVRRQVFQVLSYLPAQLVAELPDDACEDTDPLVRLAAGVALNRPGVCGKVFAASLKNDDFGVRSAAARVLGKFPHEDRINLLAQALNDPNSRVRTAAIRATGMMGGASAFPFIMKMLDDPQEAIRAYAAGNMLKLMQ